ncbi:hypothetical protein LWI28_019824 [Acer negundo]|uniref:BIRD-IDD transcription factor second C2H2 zinc finger domain-containing protein n=1 Tax=Acer negundo TaxID=4023 RepID=A0AAD5J5P1_ACENE|nr:hypothetical protein LWI28_019824 [Acer negundo]
MRSHNLPWKLKVRPSSEVIRKKVYVCPVPTYIHLNPALALRDLTGIKKHFLRKHGAKTWQCDKCSKITCGGAYGGSSSSMAAAATAMEKPAAMRELRPEII